MTDRTVRDPRNVGALEEILRDMRHDRGCSADVGQDLRCRCRLAERVAEARAEHAKLLDFARVIAAGGSDELGASANWRVAVETAKALVGELGR